MAAISWPSNSQYMAPAIVNDFPGRVKTSAANFLVETLLIPVTESVHVKI